MCLRRLPGSCTAKIFNVKTSGLAIWATALVLSGSSIAIAPASAAVASMSGALQYQMREASPLVEVYVRRGGGARRTTVIGPRGGVASRTAVRRGAVARPGVRPGVVARGGRWVRPYRWRPSGAIAAGAAIGFVTAATAAAWAGAPPVAGYCWYYTDPSRTQGFWDVCP